MSYTGTVGGPNVVAGVTIANTGSTALTIVWNDNINWLIATSGDTVSIAPGGTATITHTASTSGLAAGTHSGTATLSGGGVTKQVPITFTINAPTTTSGIDVTPANLAFTGTTGGNNPSAKTFTVTKTGTGAVTWTATDNAAWLALSPSTGTATATVTTSVNLAGLAVGTYNTTISVAVAGSSTAPKNIPVSLTVTANTATSAILTWNANTETDLAGYKIYTGTQSGVYGTPVTVGKVTSHVLANLNNGTTYFFTITAYDSAGNESMRAPEQSKSIF
jgi:Fibronectin type III domain